MTDYRTQRKAPRPDSPAGNRFDNLPAFEGQWLTLTVELPAENIQRVCTTFEAYDNLAMVRTPMQGEGRLYIYTAEENESDARKILTDLQGSFPLKITDVTRGMKDFKQLWEK